MSKYVIELRPDCKVVQQICESNGQVCIDARSIQYFEELNSDYINEHFGELQQDAYDRGYKDGRNVTETQAHDDAYQRGLEDGKAQSERGCEGCKYDANKELTCPCSECSNNYKNQWTAKDDKIEVGDGVNGIHSKEKGVVTQLIGDTQVYVLWHDGSSGIWGVNEVTKTGRHFDIASILEVMRND